MWPEMAETLVSVSRLPPSRVSSFAPRATSMVTTSLRPFSATPMRAVRPSRFAQFGIEAEVEQHPHRVEVFLDGSLVGDALHPADAAAGRQRAVAVVADHERIGAPVEQQPHQRGVARLRGADERRRAGFVEPLHREDGRASACCPSRARWDPHRGRAGT